MSRNFLRKIQPLRALYHSVKGTTPIYLDYAIDFKPRWQTPEGHPQLASIMAANTEKMTQTLADMAGYADTMHRVKQGDFPIAIKLHNGFLPVTDGLSLMWAAGRTKKTFIEIGSGNSTLYVKAGLLYHDNKATLMSIDPQPRRDIDKVCDRVFRQPVENIDLSLFDTLEAGDTLFIDNSHRAFMNSDVTTVMLDIIPRLKPGVLVGIHDIFLPFDYFESWSERIYNEQYLLGCYLLANPDYFDIRLANYWAHQQGITDKTLAPIWEALGDDILKNRKGSAFWGIKS